MSECVCGWVRVSDLQAGIVGRVAGDRTRFFTG